MLEESDDKGGCRDGYEEYSVDSVETATEATKKTKTEAVDNAARENVRKWPRN